MAGHSKWHNIRHKKAHNDAQKSKQFTKLNKEIMIAARDGGGDTEHNPKLRLLMQKARRINMPHENVTRAIKKGTGELPGVHYESHMYEGYGPHGIAIMIEALTYNKNRTASEMRHFFNKHGGTLAESGAVSWMFSRKGIIHAHHGSYTEDDMLEMLIDHDIDDLTYHDDMWHITCEPQAIEPIKRILADADMQIEEAEVRWIPHHQHALDASTYQTAAEFLDNLEHLEDVQNIYTNLSDAKASV